MGSPHAAPRVVAAVGSDLRRRLRAVLHECELRFVQTGTELVQALDEAHCDLLIVEVHLEESAAVAALKCALSRGETCRVVCICAVPWKARHAILDSLRTALGAVAAHDCIGLVDYPDDDQGNASVRAALDALLPAWA